MAILATVGVFLTIGSSDAAAGSAICLIAVLASMPYNARRIENQASQILFGSFRFH